MKTLVLLVLAGCTFGCSSQKEIQMNLSEVELVRIDTVRRYNTGSEQLLTWRSPENISYVTFEPMHIRYSVGEKMKVMVRR
jgi:hypothetical protein